MIRILKFLGFCCCFIFLCCGEDKATVEFKEIDIVTGLDLFDFNGAPIVRWETPNHKTGPAQIFPIPNNGFVFINSQDLISDIWLINGTCFRDTVNSNILQESNALNFMESEIDAISIEQFRDVNQSTLQLNLQDFSEGFYKLFYRLNTDEIFWYNMYIDPNQQNFPDLLVLDAACN